MTINLGILILCLIALAVIIYAMITLDNKSRIALLFGIGIILLPGVVFYLAHEYKLTLDDIQQIEPTIECVCHQVKCICGK